MVGDADLVPEERSAAEGGKDGDDGGASSSDSSDEEEEEEENEEMNKEEYEQLLRKAWPRASVEVVYVQFETYEAFQSAAKELCCEGSPCIVRASAAKYVHRSGASCCTFKFHSSCIASLCFRCRYRARSVRRSRRSRVLLVAHKYRLPVSGALPTAPTHAQFFLTPSSPNTDAPPIHRVTAPSVLAELTVKPDVDGFLRDSLRRGRKFERERRMRYVANASLLCICNVRLDHFSRHRYIPVSARGFMHVRAQLRMRWCSLEAIGLETTGGHLCEVRH